MTSLKELGRVVNGLSLVAKEAARRGFELEKPNQISSIIKGALLSATDLSGLTKGKIREYEVGTSSKDEGKGNSVVYFSEAEPVKSSEDLQELVVQSTSEEASSPAPTVIPAEGNDNVQETLENEGEPLRTFSGNGEGDDTIAVDGAATRPELPSPMPSLVNKQRRPRERKVPSTPFSRALGVAGQG